jgi:amidase
MKISAENHVYSMSAHNKAAAKKASNNMFRFLKERLPLSNNEIAMLMSIICDLQVSQVVVPQKTARMKVDKKALEKYNLKY